MAKPFYSIEEACDRLKKDENAIRALVREGSLREFRDGGKIFFKSEDVDKLAGGGAKADSGEITLEAADELPALLDESEGTNIIDLAPVEETTAKKKKEGTMISSAGIGVFDEDELEIDADPMAKTQITAGASTGDRGKAEGSGGGGSGLLDLTREADDTSLGAELLDEIYPGEEESAAPRRPARPEPEEEPAAAEEEAAPAAAPEPEYVAPIIVAAGDPTEGLFSGLLVGALLLLVVGGSVVAGTLQGFFPDYAHFLSNNFWPFIGVSTLMPIITLLVGWVLGRASTPRRA